MSVFLRFALVPRTQDAHARLREITSGPKGGSEKGKRPPMALSLPVTVILASASLDKGSLTKDY
jgi:hypothetical protein